MAADVPDFAQHDSRLAQNFLLAVETLMVVIDRESFRILQLIRLFTALD